MRHWRGRHRSHPIRFLQLALDHITGLGGLYNLIAACSWLAGYRWIAEISCSSFVYPHPPTHPPTRRRKKSTLRLQLLILFG